MSESKQKPKQSGTDEGEAPRSVHSARTPERDHVPDLGTRKQLAQQDGEREVARGSLDAIGVLAGETPLLHDRRTAAESDVERNALEQARLDALIVSRTLVRDAVEGRLTPVSGPATGGRDEAILRKARAEEELKAAEAEADRVAGVLAAEGPDRDGGSWAGSPIPASTVAEGRKALRDHRRVEVGVFLLVLLLEGTVTTGALYTFLRSPDYFQAAPVAVIALASLTAGPAMVGRLLARWRAGVRTHRIEQVALMALAALWLTVGFALASVRVYSEEAAYALQQAARVQAINGGGTAAAPVATYQIDHTLAVVFWTAVLLGLGIVIAAYELLQHNPARVRDLEARMLVWRLSEEHIAYSGRLDDIERAKREQRRTLRVVDRMWAKDIDAVDARTAVVDEVFSEAVVVAAASPEMTAAMEDRLARTRRTAGQADGPTHAAPHLVVPIQDGDRAADRKDAS